MYNINNIGWVDYLKNYFQKSSTNPTSNTETNLEDWVTKIENNPEDKDSALVNVKCTDNTTMIYSIPKYTISEMIIRERKIKRQQLDLQLSI